MMTNTPPYYPHPYRQSLIAVHVHSTLAAISGRVKHCSSRYVGPIAGGYKHKLIVCALVEGVTSHY